MFVFFIKFLSLFIHFFIYTDLIKPLLEKKLGLCDFIIKV